jgi:hypothetical protein
MSDAAYLSCLGGVWSRAHGSKSWNRQRVQAQHAIGACPQHHECDFAPNNDPGVNQIPCISPPN